MLYEMSRVCFALLCFALLCLVHLQINRGFWLELNVTLYLISVFAGFSQFSVCQAQVKLSSMPSMGRQYPTCAIHDPALC